MDAILSTMLGLALSVSATSPSNPSLMRVDAEAWVANPGTRLIVDTASGSGYLINPHRRTYLEFPAVTGKEETVCYGGIGCYFGKTPDQLWVIREKEKQYHDYFSPSWRFFRMKEVGANGEEFDTHYGIHGYRMADDWVGDGLRKGSLGCVVLQEKYLDIVQNTFIKNSGELYVQTVFGTGKDVLARLSWALEHPDLAIEPAMDDGIGS